jgi:3-phenylpropionate/trans-cinnamate dioxygenase ferredoxin reductase component
MHGFLNRLVRLESQQNATDQARIAARSILELPALPPAPPWFWSEQYEQKLQMTGVAVPGDVEVLRGDPGSGSFSVLYFRNGVLVALQSVDRPRDFAHGRKLIAVGAELEIGRCADGQIPLGDLVAAVRV